MTYQVCIQGKFITCEDFEAESKDAAKEQMLDNIRMDGYEISDYSIEIFEYEEGKE